VQQNPKIPVNGNGYNLTADTRRTLIEVIRSEIGMNGTKSGYEMGEYSTTMVLFDERPLRREGRARP